MTERSRNTRARISNPVSGGHSSHHPREVLLAHFSLYVHKGGLRNPFIKCLLALSLLIVLNRFD